MSVIDATEESARPRHHLAGLGWMLLAQACFAVMNVSARLAGGDLPWPEVAAARFLVGVLLAAALARARGISLRIIDQRASWGRAIFGTLSAFCTFYAITSPRIHLADAVTLGATAPMLLRHLGAGESSEAVVLHFSLVALATTVLLAIPVWRTPSPRGALFLLGTGLAGGGAQLAMTRAYSLDGAARISALTYLGILFTVLLAIPVFGEQPSLPQALGAVAIVGAGLLLARSARGSAVVD